VSDERKRAFASPKCLAWFGRGEIVRYHDLYSYRFALHIDNDVFVKRPLSRMFADFDSFIAADPTEKINIHVVPERVVWSAAYAATDGMEWFRHDPIDPVDMENRRRHHIRPFNNGIFLFHVSSNTTSVIRGAQSVVETATCDITEQPIYNDYLGKRLLASWRFLHASPSIDQMPTVAEYAKNRPCMGMRSSNRALLLGSTCREMEHLWTSAHVLVHVVCYLLLFYVVF